MDLSAIIVILVLTALPLAALVWMELHSRKRKREEASGIDVAAGVRSSGPAGNPAQARVRTTKQPSVLSETGSRTMRHRLK